MEQDYTPVGPTTPPPVDPFSPQTQGFDRAAKRRRYLWMGCGGCAVIAVLAMFFGGWAMVRLGLDVFANDVESELRDNPVIIEHIGRIENLEVDLTASLSTEENDDFVFTVTGTKGSGLIHATCITRDDGTEAVTAGTIQLESGETLDLFPE